MYVFFFIFYIVLVSFDVVFCIIDEEIIFFFIGELRVIFNGMRFINFILVYVIGNGIFIFVCLINFILF